VSLRVEMGRSNNFIFVVFTYELIGMEKGSYNNKSYNLVSR
jgi:hypothetical protein